MDIDADVAKTTKISLGINGREQLNNASTLQRIMCSQYHN